MQNFLRLSGLAAAALAFAAFAPNAVAEDNTTVWSCQNLRLGPLEPLGDREGHSISVGQYTCHVESGPFAGGVSIGTNIYEWDGPKAVELSDSGVVRKPGATAAWKAAEGGLTLTMTNGKVTGWMASGRGTWVLATGGWASMAGKPYTWTAKPVGPMGQFSIEESE